MEEKATLVTNDSDFRRLGHGFSIVWLKGEIRPVDISVGPARLNPASRLALK
jgi:hypothetical protein